MDLEFLLGLLLNVLTAVGWIVIFTIIISLIPKHGYLSIFYLSQFLSSLSKNFHCEGLLLLG